MSGIKILFDLNYKTVKVDNSLINVQKKQQSSPRDCPQTLYFSPGNNDFDLEVKKELANTTSFVDNNRINGGVTIETTV